MTMRPGRNDPCPCGSGKKYKKCCLGHPMSEATSDPEAGTPGTSWSAGDVSLFATPAFAGYYSDVGVSEVEVRFRANAIHKALSHLGWLRDDPRNILLDYVDRDRASSYAEGGGPPLDDLICGFQRDTAALRVPMLPGQREQPGHEVGQVVVMIRDNLLRRMRELPAAHVRSPFALKMLLHELTHAFGVMPNNPRCGSPTTLEVELITDCVVFESLPPRLRRLDLFNQVFDHVLAYERIDGQGAPPIEPNVMQAITRRVRDAVGACSADADFRAGPRDRS